MTIQEAREKKHELEKELENCVHYFIESNEDLILDFVNIVITEEIDSCGKLYYNVSVSVKVNI